MSKKNQKPNANGSKNRTPKGGVSKAPNQFPAADIEKIDLDGCREAARSYSLGRSKNIVEETFHGAIVFRNSPTNLLCVGDRTDVAPAYRALQIVRALKQPRVPAVTENLLRRAYGEQLTLISLDTISTADTIYSIISSDPDVLENSKAYKSQLYTKTYFIKGETVVKRGLTDENGVKSADEVIIKTKKGNKSITCVKDLVNIREEDSSIVSRGAVIGLFSDFEGLSVASFEMDNNAGQIVVLAGLKLTCFTVSEPSENAKGEDGSSKSLGKKAETTKVEVRKPTDEDEPYSGASEDNTEESN